MEGNGRTRLLAFYRVEKGEEEFNVDGISVFGWSGLKRKCKEVFDGRKIDYNDIGIVCCGLETLPVSSVRRLKDYLVAELNHVHRPMKLGYDGKNFSLCGVVGTNGYGGLIWSRDGEIFTRQEALAILDIVGKSELRLDSAAVQELADREQK